jgi:hypothetical protein
VGVIPTHFGEITMRSIELVQPKTKEDIKKMKVTPLEEPKEQGKNWIYKIVENKCVEAKVVYDDEYERLLKKKEWNASPAVKESEPVASKAE